MFIFLWYSTDYISLFMLAIKTCLMQYCNCSNVSTSATYWKLVQLVF